MDCQNLRNTHLDRFVQMRTAFLRKLHSAFHSRDAHDIHHSLTYSPLSTANALDMFHPGKEIDEFKNRYILMKRKIISCLSEGNLSHVAQLQKVDKVIAYGSTQFSLYLHVSPATSYCCSIGIYKSLSQRNRLNTTNLELNSFCGSQ